MSLSIHPLFKFIAIVFYSLREDYFELRDTLMWQRTPWGFWSWGGGEKAPVVGTLAYSFILMRVSQVSQISLKFVIFLPFLSTLGINDFGWSFDWLSYIHLPIPSVISLVIKWLWPVKFSLKSTFCPSVFPNDLVRSCNSKCTIFPSSTRTGEYFIAGENSDCLLAFTPFKWCQTSV